MLSARIAELHCVIHCLLANQFVKFASFSCRKPTHLRFQSAKNAVQWERLAGCCMLELPQRWECIINNKQRYVVHTAFSRVLWLGSLPTFILCWIYRHYMDIMCLIEISTSLPHWTGHHLAFVGETGFGLATPLVVASLWGSFSSGDERLWLLTCTQQSRVRFAWVWCGDQRQTHHFHMLNHQSTEVFNINKGVQLFLQHYISFL